MRAAAVGEELADDVVDQLLKVLAAEDEGDLLLLGRRLCAGSSQNSPVKTAQLLAVCSLSFSGCELLCTAWRVVCFCAVASHYSLLGCPTD